MATRASGGLLPAEYQRVEYLKSTGSQYIKLTDLFLTNKQFELVCQSDYVNDTTVIFGYGAGGGYWFGTVGGRYSITVHSWTNVAITDKVTVFITYSSNYISVNIGNDALSRSFSGSPRALTLFSGQGSSAWYPASVKVYSLKSDGFINLIPCVRKSDNKPGMYDTVSKTFYTNAGSGEFIVPA